MLFTTAMFIAIHYVQGSVPLYQYLLSHYLINPYRGGMEEVVLHYLHFVNEGIKIHSSSGVCTEENYIFSDFFNPESRQREVEGCFIQKHFMSGNLKKNALR
jgi:hypothetical protein